MLMPLRDSNTAEFWMLVCMCTMYVYSWPFLERRTRTGGVVNDFKNEVRARTIVFNDGVSAFGGSAGVCSGSTDGITP